MSDRCSLECKEQWFRRRSRAQGAHLDPLQTPSLMIVTARQAPSRTSTGSSRSGRRDGCGRGKLFIL